MSSRENRAESADPVILFDYFTVNENRMFFGLRDVSAELLVYVVDSTASINDMLWALDRYAGERNVGARFFDIDYDHDHFRKGEPKKVTIAGWNLPNILRYGGVCADQAESGASMSKHEGEGPELTIEGGQPRRRRRGHGAGTMDVPVGFETLLYQAARDAAFKRRLLADRESALEDAGIRLRPSEAAMLSGMAIGSTQLSEGSEVQVMDDLRAYMLPDHQANHWQSNAHTTKLDFHHNQLV